LKIDKTCIEACLRFFVPSGRASYCGIFSVHARVAVREENIEKDYVEGACEEEF
jgi:hypothetical protein